MAPEHHRLNVLDRYVERLGQEHPVPSRVEDAGHAENPLTGKPAGFHGDIAHHVKRIGDDDDDRLRRHPGDLLGDRAYDAGVRLHEIVTAHSGLPSDPCGDYEHLSSGGLIVVVATDDPGIEALDRT